MLDLHLTQNRRTIIGHSDLSIRRDHYFVEPYEYATVDSGSALEKADCAETYLSGLAMSLQYWQQCEPQVCETGHHSGLFRRIVRTSGNMPTLIASMP
jgi:hypothetical protein